MVKLMGWWDLWLGMDLPEIQPVHLGYDYGNRK